MCWVQVSFLSTVIPSNRDFDTHSIVEFPMKIGGIFIGVFLLETSMASLLPRWGANLLIKHHRLIHEVLNLTGQYLFLPYHLCRKPLRRLRTYRRIRKTQRTKDRSWKELACEQAHIWGHTRERQRANIKWRSDSAERSPVTLFAPTPLRRIASPFDIRPLPLARVPPNVSLLAG